MLQKTIFDCVRCRILLQKISTWFFKFKKWTLVGEIPPTIKKYVIAAAPHTTWLDLPCSLMIASHFQMRIFWIGKEELFVWPFKGFLGWIGGLAVKRSGNLHKTDYFGKMLREYKGSLQLVIAPAGTRKNIPVALWKRGYYDIAVKAGVPIVFFFINYTKKEAGVGMIFYPTNDYNIDIKIIEKFYKTYVEHQQT